MIGNILYVTWLRPSPPGLFVAVVELSTHMHRFAIDIAVPLHEDEDTLEWRRRLARQHHWANRQLWQAVAHEHPALFGMCQSLNLIPDLESN